MNIIHNHLTVQVVVLEIEYQIKEQGHIAQRKLCWVPQDTRPVTAVDRVDDELQQ